MTMPCERTRALRFAGEFLNSIQQDRTMSEAFRNEARHILRHYPSNDEIRRMALESARSSALYSWLAPETELEPGEPKRQA